MFPNLGRAQQKGLLVLSALVLSYLFISHWAGLRQTQPLSPVVGAESRQIVISNWKAPFKSRDFLPISDPPRFSG